MRLAANSFISGLATEALIEILLAAPESADVMSLSVPEGDRNLLAAILMKEDEELTAERVEGAVRALRRIQLRRRLEQVQRELQPEAKHEPSRLHELLQEKVRLKRALMDPGLPESGGFSACRLSREDVKLITLV